MRPHTWYHPAITAAKSSPRGDGRPVTELAVQVLAPAVGRAADRHAAAEVAAGVHDGEAQLAGDARRDRALGRGPVPELAPDVIAPAIRGAMSGRAARVDVAGAHPGKPEHPHDGSGERPVPRRGGARRAVAQPAPAVDAPTGR